MKSISASARHRIVKRCLQVVFPQKPGKDPPGFLKPLSLFGQLVYLKASRYRRTRFNRLLIESRASFPVDIETAGSDGDEDVRIVAVLLGHKPFESIHSCFNHSMVVAAPAGKDEGLRQPGVGVRETLL